MPILLNFVPDGFVTNKTLTSQRVMTSLSIFHGILIVLWNSLMIPPIHDVLAERWTITIIFLFILWGALNGILMFVSGICSVGVYKGNLAWQSKEEIVATGAIFGAMIGLGHQMTIILTFIPAAVLGTMVAILFGLALWRWRKQGMNSPTMRREEAFLMAFLGGWCFLVYAFDFLLPNPTGVSLGQGLCLTAISIIHSITIATSR
jgi:hypothetical protein